MHDYLKVRYIHKYDANVKSILNILFNNILEKKILFVH